MQADQPINSAVVGEQQIETNGDSMSTAEKLPVGESAVEKQALEGINDNQMPVNDTADPAVDDVTQDSQATSQADLVNAEHHVKTVLDDMADIEGDAQYRSAIKKVIKEESNKPYLEEEDSEDLQRSYLKERFGIHVADDEDKGRK